MIVDEKSFGQKVRMIRKEKGLTLSEMAERTERSVSLLSQIENGNVSPSFSSMQTIAHVLGVPLGQIIAGETASEESDIYHHIEASARKVLTTQGGVQHQLLTRGLPLSFEFSVIEVPPGASTGEFSYSHEGEESGLLLEGELNVEINGQVHPMKPGDSVTMKSNFPHRLSNPGKKTARAVWVNSVPYIFSTI